MNLFNTKNSHPLTITRKSNIKNLCFNGKNFFFTLSHKKKIIMTNENYKVQKIYKTISTYTLITYDYIDRCFWAIDNYNFNKILKLDENMHEIDSIHICNCISNGNKIIDLTFNYCDNSIIFSFKNKIIEFYKSTNKTKTLLANNKECIRNILYVCPYVIMNIHKNNSDYIKIINPSTNEKLLFKVPSHLNVNGLVFNTTTMNIELLIKKHCCYPYIAIVESSRLNLKHIFCTNIYSLYNIVSSNYCIDELDNKINIPEDILCSIYKLEYSISNILDTQSCKLKEILKSTDNIDDILKVNKEIQKTIVNTTHLEQLLYSKLELLIENNINKNKCDCDICTQNNKFTIT